jgi:long-chain acyl-CoA synthetase
VTLAQFRPAGVIAAIEEHRISDIIVVPTMLQSLLDEPSFTPQRVQSLDRIAFGAAPMRARSAGPGAGRVAARRVLPGLLD